MKAKNVGKVLRALVKKELLIQTSELYELNKQELFSKKETAKILGTSERSLDRWRNDNLISALDNKENGKVLFKKQEIVRFLKTI